MKFSRYRIVPEAGSWDWETPLARVSTATAFHTQRWGAILARAFPRLRPLPLHLFQGERSIGVMPCYLFRPVPGLAMLHSLHWNLPGGPLLWEPDATDAVELTRALLQTLRHLARRHRLTEVQIHTSPFGSPLDVSQLRDAGFESPQTRFTHLLDIRPGREAVWTAYNKRVRGAVRKAAKHGVTVRLTEAESDMRVFYEMYLAMMRHFGSAPKPYDLLRALQISDLGHLTVAEYEGQIIGGLLFLHFGRVVTLWVEASLPEYLHLRTNNAVIDFIVAWACERGYDWVDFGASPPERKGLIAFKEEWRARRVEFFTYRWVCAPHRRALWERMEPTLRRAYGWLQGRGFRGNEGGE